MGCVQTAPEEGLSMGWTLGARREDRGIVVWGLNLVLTPSGDHMVRERVLGPERGGRDTEMARTNTLINLEVAEGQCALGRLSSVPLKRIFGEFSGGIIHYLGVALTSRTEHGSPPRSFAVILFGPYEYAGRARTVTTEQPETQSLWLFVGGGDW